MVNKTVQNYAVFTVTKYIYQHTEVKIGKNKCNTSLFAFWLGFQCFWEFKINREILITLVPVELVSLGFSHIARHYASWKAKSVSQI